MKILHLIHDNKFFGYVSGLFALLPQTQNRFVAFAPGTAPTTHIEGLGLWRRVGRGYFLSNAARADLDWCDCLVVHFVEPWGALLMLRAPARVAKVWSGWGGDYLALLPEGEEEWLGAETIELLKSIHRRQRRRSLRETARRLLADGLRIVDRPLLAAAAARADFFSAPLKEDYDMLRGALGTRFHATYVQLRYGSNEVSHDDLPVQPAGDDILLGNSATPTNNHAEALRLLAGLDLGARKVIVPLSYGDPDYRDAVLELGQRLLGARFEPLLEFMPMAEYNARIARCGVVIMNHRRQQGLGNIAAAMHCGARIYLDETGLMYRFFTGAGAHVFSTRLLEGKGAAWAAPLEPERQAKNRAVLASLWSQDAAVRNANLFVQEVAAWQTTRA